MKMSGINGFYNQKKRCCSLELKPAAIQTIDDPSKQLYQSLAIHLNSSFQILNMVLHLSILVLCIPRRAVKIQG